MTYRRSERHPRRVDDLPELSLAVGDGLEEGEILSRLPEIRPQQEFDLVEGGLSLAEDLGGEVGEKIELRVEPKPVGRDSAGDGEALSAVPEAAGFYFTDEYNRVMLILLWPRQE